jgi:hypothetical protein
MAGEHSVKKLGSVMMVAAVAAMPFLVTSTADAAVNPRTHYSLSYGGGEYTLKGNIIWYNRTVQVGASLKATEANCAMARYRFYHGSKLVSDTKRVACSGTKGHGYRRTYNQRGGITRVAIDLSQSNANHGWTHLTSSNCTRRGCS